MLYDCVNKIGPVLNGGGRGGLAKWVTAAWNLWRCFQRQEVRKKRLGNHKSGVLLTFHPHSASCYFPDLVVDTDCSSASLYIQIKCKICVTCRACHRLSIRNHWDIDRGHSTYKSLFVQWLNITAHCSQHIIGQFQLDFSIQKGSNLFKSDPSNCTIQPLMPHNACSLSFQEVNNQEQGG